jgi:hypothetical protein
MDNFATIVGAATDEPLARTQWPEQISLTLNRHVVPNAGYPRLCRAQDAYGRESIAGQ